MVRAIRTALSPSMKAKAPVELSRNRWAAAVVMAAPMSLAESRSAANQGRGKRIAANPMQSLSWASAALAGVAADAGNVDVNIGSGSTITAHGTGQSGLLAQSVGGGGGNGGMNVSGGIVSDSSLIVGVGGFAGNGGQAGDVTVTSQADITVTTDPDDISIPDTTTFEDKLRDFLGDYDRRSDRRAGLDLSGWSVCSSTWGSSTKKSRIPMARPV